MGFADTPTAVLEAARDNLLRGLDLVAERLDEGTFHTVGHKGEAPPSQSGHLTRILLEGVEAELAQRRAAT